MIDFLVSLQLGKIIIVNNSNTHWHYITDKYKHKVQEIKTDPLWWVSYAKNEGIKYATSDYFYFLDDDVFPLDTDRWERSLFALLKSNEEYDCVWGNIYLPNNFHVPQHHKQYSYFYGEKNFWEKDTFVNGYFWWANCIFHNKVFNSTGGFPEQFWHIQEKRGFNEDIFIQEYLLSKKKKLFFKSWLDVIHYGAKYLSEQDFLVRLKQQWYYDYLMDKKLNRSKLVLRLIKYSIIFFLGKIIRFNSFDLVRYEAYLTHKKN